MKTKQEIERLATQDFNNRQEYGHYELADLKSRDYYYDGFANGYTQGQEDMVNAFLLLIKEYKNKELPNCNKPFHHEAEISSGLDGLVNYIKNKQD